jgi:hypothetical protein
MKIAIVYIYPEAGGNGHFERALNFVQSYHQCEPRVEHDTVIICNGGKADDETKYLFESLPNCTFLEHDDSGFDIGGYQLAAKSYPCDLMVFLGGNSYIRGPGWLRRIANVFQEQGDNLYGCTGNQGDMRFGVFPHVRTTGFWCSPKLINDHPLRVTDNSQRYPYEHGPNGLTTWALRTGRQAFIVGWNEIRDVHSCDSMPEGFHQGQQANIIIGDRLTAPPYHHCP